MPRQDLHRKHGPMPTPNALYPGPYPTDMHASVQPPPWMQPPPWANMQPPPWVNMQAPWQYPGGMPGGMQGGMPGGGPGPYPAEMHAPWQQQQQYAADMHAAAHHAEAPTPYRDSSYPRPTVTPHPTGGPTPRGSYGGRQEFSYVEHLWTPDPHRTCNAKTGEYSVEANHWCETHCLGCGNSCDCPPSMCECHNRTEDSRKTNDLQTKMSLCSSLDFPTGRPYECFAGFAAETEDPFSSTPWYDERHCETACVHPFLDLTSGVAEWRGPDTVVLPPIRKSLKFFQPPVGNWIDNTRSIIIDNTITRSAQSVSFVLTATEANASMLKLQFAVDNLGSNYSYTATLNDATCTRHWGTANTCNGSLAAWYSRKGLDGSGTGGALTIQTNSSAPLKAGVNVLTVDVHGITRKAGIYLMGGVYPAVPGPEGDLPHGVFDPAVSRRVLDFMDGTESFNNEEGEAPESGADATQPATQPGRAWAWGGGNLGSVPA